MKRIITEFEEQVIRLVHHDHGGLTTKEAAKQLNVSKSSVQRALRTLKKKAPQLFPILNKRQLLIRTYITDYGFTHREIAEITRLPIKTIDRVVMQMRNKGVVFVKPVKTVSYQPYMDSQVRHKF